MGVAAGNCDGQRGRRQPQKASTVINGKVVFTTCRPIGGAFSIEAQQRGAGPTQVMLSC